jgi:integrase
MSGFNEAHFRAWLVGAGYRPQSAAKYASDAACYLFQEKPGEDVSKSRYAALKRARGMLEWYCDDGQAKLVLPEMAPEPSAENPRTAKLLSRRAAQKHRKEVNLRSVDDDEWSKLWACVLDDDSVSARVVEVMMATGLRIGDVLRISVIALGNALLRKDGALDLEVKGGKIIPTTVDAARESWTKLHKACGRSWTVASAVAPGGKNETYADAGGGGAYQAVSRTLKACAEDAGVTGRVHPHRLRRTVGVQTARDVGRYAAQQLLGHTKGSTTDTYLDETNVDVVREAQMALAKRRGTK